MDYEALSQNGVEKVINNAPAVVQIIDYQVKEKNNAKFFIAEISPQVKRFDVIKSQIGSSNMHDDKPLHVLLEKFKILRDDIDCIIGQPISYNDWLKTKSNPKGQSLLPPRKNPIQNVNLHQKPKMNIFSAAFGDQQDEKPSGNKIKIPVPFQKKVSQLSNTQSIQSNPKLQLNNQSNSQSNNQSNPKPLLQKTLLNAKPALNNQTMTNKTTRPKTILVSNEKKQSNMKKPPQQPQRANQNDNRHDRSYFLVKELYEGMEDWKLKVRVTFASPVKNYFKKNNGQESQIFAFEACDSNDCLQFTAFGDSAPNFHNIIKIDHVYEISGGKITKDNDKNKLKIFLNEKSSVNLMEDDLTIPSVEEYCLTPDQLLQKDTGSQWNVIALVKDVSQVVNFVSKIGKNCKKKQIYLCDPQAQVQIPLTLWFDKADLVFEKIPYAFQGITVSQFNNNRQFATSIRFNFRPCKHHQFRKYLNSYENMKLDNPIQDSTAKGRINRQIFNFMMLKEEAQKLQGNNTMSMQKVCYLSQISLTSKNFYLSCPYCKKKVMDEENGTCMSQRCGKAYQKGKYRYLLNVSLCDESDSIWGIAYDEAAESMQIHEGKPFTANDFAKFGEEQLKLIIPQFLDKEVKAIISAKKETYNKMPKIKFSINKASLIIDYENEQKMLDKQTKKMLDEQEQGIVIPNRKEDYVYQI